MHSSRADRDAVPQPAFFAEERRCAPPGDRLPHPGRRVDDADDADGSVRR